MGSKAGALKAMRHWTCPHCRKKMHVNRGGFNVHVKNCTDDHEARFWSKVDKTGSCWLYCGAVNTTGYGMFIYRGKKNTVAHRLAWRLLKGPIPAGKLVLHKCDTPRCCNPDHLFLGTDADNTADKISKGRSGTDGERNVHAKLTEEAVRIVRAEYRSWREGSIKRSNAQELADRYGVCTGAITAVTARRSWRHIA